MKDTPADDRSRAPANASSGVLLGLSAYLLWGAMPIYMKAVGAVPAPQILAHRILWSLALLAGVVALLRRWQPVLALIRRPRTLAVLALSAVLIAVNWLIYIWAVNADRVLETSLGYFITPLVSIALGLAVLGERLRPVQIGAVALAAAGVAVMAVAGGGLPWVAVGLAVSFGFYGLIRKAAPVDPLTGLLAETALLGPFAAVYLGVAAANGTAGFGRNAELDMLLILSGPITAAPLLLFAAAGKRLRLATLGLLQFVAPTIQFLLAVLLYNEPLGAAQLVTFTCIWTGLAIYVADTWRAGANAAR